MVRSHNKQVLFAVLHRESLPLHKFLYIDRPHALKQSQAQDLNMSLLGIFKIPEDDLAMVPDKC